MPDHQADCAAPWVGTSTDSLLDRQTPNKLSPNGIESRVVVRPPIPGTTWKGVPRAGAALPGRDWQRLKRDPSTNAYLGVVERAG